MRTGRWRWSLRKASADGLYVQEKDPGDPVAHNYGLL